MEDIDIDKDIDSRLIIVKINVSKLFNLRQP